MKASRLFLSVALVTSIAASAGVPVVRSFMKATDAVRYFGSAVPVPHPTEPDRFAICYRSPEGQPTLSVYFEFKGRGLADGVQTSTYFVEPGKAFKSQRFRAYQMSCAISSRATPAGVAQKTRLASFSSMADVFRYLGPAPPGKHPSETDLFAACYTSPPGKPPSWILIEAKGEDVDTSRVTGSVHAVGRRTNGIDHDYKGYRLTCVESANLSAELWETF